MSTTIVILILWLLVVAVMILGGVLFIKIVKSFEISVQYELRLSEEE